MRPSKSKVADAAQLLVIAALMGALAGVVTSSGFVQLLIVGPGTLVANYATWVLRSAVKARTSDS
jgi:hypothetical protein